MNRMNAADPSLRITFLDRRKHSVRHSLTLPITEADLHTLWLDKHLLNVLSPGYILTRNPSTTAPFNPTNTTDNPKGNGIE
jgi:hypothetical protein